MDKHEYDALLLYTPVHFQQMLGCLNRIAEFLPVKNIYICGSKDVEELFNKDVFCSGSNQIKFINENEILPRDHVAELMRRLYSGVNIAEKSIGWYYQQFLKLNYSRICKDDYYMSWDGDTIPLGHFSMFKQVGSSYKPYFDIKHQDVEQYYPVISRILPGYGKAIRQSFISEHMIFDIKICTEMLDEIESNSQLKGKSFWEKIIHAIPPENLNSNYFSEFETYGTYVTLKHTSAYVMREWNSFRHGSEVFDLNEMNDDDYKWLGESLPAITFESYHGLTDELHEIFNNTQYRKKLTAAQIVQLIQQYVTDGNGGKVVW